MSWCCVTGSSSSITLTQPIRPRFGCGSLFGGGNVPAFSIRASGFATTAAFRLRVRGGVVVIGSPSVHELEHRLRDLQVALRTLEAHELERRAELRHRDGLGAAELAQTVGAVDAAETGLADAAEGQRGDGGEAEHRVDRHHAVAQALGELTALLLVAREDRRAETVVRAVRALDGLVEVADLVDDDRRTEDR